MRGIELFRDVKHVLESSDSPDLAKLAMRLSDALVTYAHDLRVGTNAVVGNAIRQIRENLKNGIVRLTPLYAQPHIGHTALGRAFRQTGLGSPAEFIRQEQLRVVKRLLKTTQKPITAIAREAVARASCGGAEDSKASFRIVLIFFALSSVMECRLRSGIDPFHSK